jgi:hypothetical protein
MADVYFPTQHWSPTLRPSKHTIQLSAYFAMDFFRFVYVVMIVTSSTLFYYSVQILAADVAFQG